MTDVESEIRARIERYVRGDMSVTEFEAWFTPFTWAMDDSDLVNEVRLLLAEYGSEAWDELRLRDALEAVSGRITLAASGPLSAMASVGLPPTAGQPVSPSANWPGQLGLPWKVTDAAPQTSSQPEPTAA